MWLLILYSSPKESALPNRDLTQSQVQGPPIPTKKQALAAVNHKPLPLREGMWKAALLGEENSPWVSTFQTQPRSPHRAQA